MFSLTSPVRRGAAVALFCVLSAFAVWVANRDDRVTQQANARSCPYIDDSARAFIADKLPAILSTARRHERLAPQQIEQLYFDAAFIRDGARQCRSLAGRALGTRITLAEYFRPHDELFSPLEDFLREWRFARVEDMRNVEPRLAHLEALEHTLPMIPLATASAPHP